MTSRATVYASSIGVGEVAVDVLELLVRRQLADDVELLMEDESDVFKVAGVAGCAHRLTLSHRNE